MGEPNLTQIKVQNPRRLRSGLSSRCRIRIRNLGMRNSVLQLAFSLVLMNPALAASPAEQRGKTFAMTNCSKCHSIDRVTQSPLKIAPPFRDLHLRYPVEGLAEALAEGIETGHPTMPRFQLDPDQIHDLLSYLKSLE
jgi:cytochrome c